MKPHRMHLHGPWQFEWLPEASPAECRPRSGRVKLPDDWNTLLADASGTVLLRRRFHKPTNLEPHERVYVVISGLKRRMQISLNEEFLGSVELPQGTVDFEITNRLQPSNELSLEFTWNPESAAAESDSRHCSLWESVAIEIRAESTT